MSDKLDTQSIPETAMDALKEWQVGNTVPTVEMGGLGPGYERAIQTLAFGILNRFKDERIDWEALDQDDEKERSRVLAISDEVIDDLNETWGFSGAQVGAAKGLAFRTLRVGWRNALEEVRREDPDRIIMISQDQIIMGD